MSTIKQSDFQSFAEFYPYYLQEHTNVICRRLHFFGTLGVLLIAAAVVAGASPWWLLAMPVFGYGFAWVGHFVFEKNRPATFQHPFYSLAGDFVMFKDILLRRIAW
ncbi:Mpo1-like protein [Isoalcanivorax beigongshangi]|uniref:Mpo1-like protein n=1 Tax=Isoalcanivorax beigongshangi TaxID=3238810 RepID=A0ABV4AIQ5_9GAMM